MSRFWLKTLLLVFCITIFNLSLWMLTAKGYDRRSTTSSSLFTQPAPYIPPPQSTHLLLKQQVENFNSNISPAINFFGTKNSINNCDLSSPTKPIDQPNMSCPLSGSGLSQPGSFGQCCARIKNTDPTDQSKALNIRHNNLVREALSKLPTTQVPAPAGQSGIVAPKTEYDVDPATKVEVKNICTTCYDGPQTSDFLDRVKIVSEAIKDLCSQNTENENKHCPKNLDDDVSKIASRYEHYLKTEAALDPAEMQKGINTGDTKYFDHKKGKALKALQEMVTKYISYLKQTKMVGASFKPDDLREIENNYVVKKGRKTFVHNYQVDDDDKSINRSFVSTHRPIKKPGEMINSATRNKGGLANFIETSFQVRDRNGELKTKFSAHRHSSYPPIAVKDDIERQVLATKNAEEMLNKLVIDYKDAHNGSCPTEIPLSTMILLTPSWTDQARGIENEAKQINESYTALRTFDGRQVRIDGCEVTPKVNVMNRPSNDVFRVSADKDEDEKNLNAKGFEENQKAIHEFTSGNLCKIMTAAKDKDLSKIIDPELLKKLTAEQEQLLNLYYGNSEKIKDTEALIKNKESEIRKKYETLDIANKQYLKLHEKVLNKTINSREKKYLELTKKHIKKISDEIKAEESAIGKLYQKIDNVRAENYNKNWSEIRAREKKLTEGFISMSKKIKGHLNTKNQNLNTTAMIELSEKLQQQSDIIKLNGDAVEIHRKKMYNQWKHRNDFQRNYLLTNYMIGRNVDFFCKSAEDRTGRVNNKIEEALIFKEKFGRFPGYNEPNDDAELAKIARKVHYGSASRDTTGANNPGARGLQIVDDPHLEASKLGHLDDNMGKLAKGMYKNVSTKSVGKQQEEESDE